MKQILQNLKTGATEVSEVPCPRASAGQLLIRTTRSLVSAGTERMLVEFAGKSLLGKARSRPDLLKQMLDKARREGLLPALDAAFNRLDQPLLLGYSSAGMIVGLGAGVTGLKIGQRVACAGGGYAVHAEYAVVPQPFVTPIPDQLDFESAAFTTLGAIALHGFRLAESQLGERVAVIGLGLLGLIASGIARAAGCHVLGIDLDLPRVEFASHLGLQAVARQSAEEAAASFSRGCGVDAVLICADTPTSDPVELAGVISRDRARVVAVGAVGLTIPRKLYYEKELTFLNSRSYGPGRYDRSYEEGGRDYPIGYVRWTEGRNLEAFVDLLAGEKVDVKSLITHRLPIEQAPEAYQLIQGKTAESYMGVLLTYPPAPDLSLPDVLAQPGLSKVELVGSRGQPGSTGEVKPLQVGVLGAGNFASAVLLPAMRKIPALDMVGIVSASGATAGHLARRFGFQYASSDEAGLLADERINTVAILTRHHLHSRQVVSALRAGKHVFCEKPLALTLQELAEIESVLVELGAAEREVPSFSAPLLTVGFNRRFAPLARRLKEFIQECYEPLFCSYRVNAGYLPPNHWTQDPEQGGGRLVGEACHFVDFITYLVGEAPSSISAHSLPDLGRYNQDNFLLACEFPDGSLGAVSYLANGDRSFGKERLEVFCGGRTAMLDDFRRLELVSGGRRKSNRSLLRQDKGHQAEWQAFASAIQAGGPLPIPYAHLLGVSRSVIAARESLLDGQKKILFTGEPDDIERI